MTHCLSCFWLWSWKQCSYGFLKASPSCFCTTIWDEYIFIFEWSVSLGRRMCFNVENTWALLQLSAAKEGKIFLGTTSRLSGKPAQSEKRFWTFLPDINALPSPAKYIPGDSTDHSTLVHSTERTWPTSLIDTYHWQC